MAITAQLVFAGHNRLRYLITATVGGSEFVDIPCVGGATPDLLTDSLAGPIKQIARVKTQGYGLIPVGGISSQGEARALLASDDNLALVGPNMPTLITRLPPQRTGNAKAFMVDAVEGAGDPTTPSLRIVAVLAGTCYLDIEVPGSIGP